MSIWHDKGRYRVNPAKWVVRHMEMHYHLFPNFIYAHPSARLTCYEYGLHVQDTYLHFK
jgi:hypothetical protein